MYNKLLIPCLVSGQDSRAIKASGCAVEGSLLLRCLVTSWMVAGGCRTTKSTSCKALVASHMAQQACTIPHSLAAASTAARLTLWPQRFTTLAATCRPRKYRVPSKVTCTKSPVAHHLVSSGSSGWSSTTHMREPLAVVERKEDEYNMFLGCDWYISIQIKNKKIQSKYFNDKN